MRVVSGRQDLESLFSESDEDWGKEMSETKQLPIAISKEELAQFCQRYPIRKLSLFGSVLRDDFTLESDIDF